ncbi:hypothetical protein [Arthrobacter sedimenti]|nr:hypothetical protein [Arthrobacter sedimenti]
MLGLVIAVVAGIAVAVLQANGGVQDPARLVCDLATRAGDCD